MFVKPAPGRLVRDPASKIAVPDTGITVNENEMFWARRLRDGDLVEATPPAPPAPAPSAAAPAVAPATIAPVPAAT